MTDELAKKFARMRQTINLQRPDRMPFSGDWGYIEYRKDVYHLGEPELVSELGKVVDSDDGKRRYTLDGGVWAVGDRDQYRDHEDVLRVDPHRFEVEQVGPAMLDEMAQLYVDKARTCFPVPWHYGTLVTRAVLEFGWEPFLMAAAVDPERLGAILDRFGAASLAVAQGWAQTEGVELIVIHDDIAGTRGILMRPQWYRTYVFPWYRRIFEAIHAQGRKVLYISDGNTLQVLDDLVETGADGLYIETTSMDPEVFMQRAGEKKLYMLKSDSRNIDLGTREDIRAEMHQLRALHAQYPGIFMYRGGGNPRPGNAEMFAQLYQELLVYDGEQIRTAKGQDMTMDSRDWQPLAQRHRAFWDSAAIDRPLIYVMYDAYQDTELVAAMLGAGQVAPEAIDPAPILGEYDKMAQARIAIGDDAIAVAEPLLGIPWLEAMAGCQVMVADGKSVWPAQPNGAVNEIAFDPQNPWLIKLLELLHVVVDHAAGRYAVGLSHLRGPADILVALHGSTPFFVLMVEEAERVLRLAQQAAALWRQVVEAQMRVVPAFRGGYGVRQFGLWAPERAVWLQDDTSSMMSADHYRQLFLEALQQMSWLPYGVLHLHIGSLHAAEMLAEMANVRAVNLYFDDPQVTLQQAMPTLQRLQARQVPLILAKDVYQGFSLAEYAEIMDGLSPRGLSVHLGAESVEQGRDVMAAVKRIAQRHIR